MRDVGKQLNEILKSLLKIVDLDKKIEKMEKKLIKKWTSYAE